MDPGLAPWKVLAVSHVLRNGIVDLFFERRVERCWRLRGGRVVAVETASIEGAACRRPEGRLAARDGLERKGLAALIGVSARQLPPVPLPAAPVAPIWDELGAPVDPDLVTVRWLWRAGFVAGTAGVSLIARPTLLDLSWSDGRRTVRPWPLAPDWGLPAPTPLRTAHPPAGAVRVLLAPQAAATLLHELLGHPLEADLLRAGSSPWRQSLGSVVLPLDLELWDDPTRWDLPGAFDCDDEGTVATPHRLVEAGRLVGALGDRWSLNPDAGPGGNARRATLHMAPRPRVSNLVARVPGALAQPPRHDADLEVEAVSAATLEARAGLLVLQVRIGHTLRHGRRVRPLGSFALVGQVEQVAKGLLAAAGTPERSAEPGWCGKDGEIVPTGSEAPWLLVEGLEAR
ncbi:MAG: hypothetical protein KA072_13275 [Thermoanaerobaculaceae bacterium]|nr:hypothetical protein [Thermoanaerobaculaceae bacterium]MDI9623184.1 metallopeptidase TldD-related protein [Acidobacteriota bacterium]NLH11101.1 hypothetical protein [Holophagae bacterium]HPW54235.1 metallopeptidase TldD-related protein [Thermoanaerobaculaceae bacterium]